MKARLFGRFIVISNARSLKGSQPRVYTVNHRFLPLGKVVHMWTPREEKRFGRKEGVIYKTEVSEKDDQDPTLG